MRPAQRDISLADVLRIWSRLDVKERATRHAVMRLLGLPAQSNLQAKSPQQPEDAAASTEEASPSLPSALIEPQPLPYVRPPRQEINLEEEHMDAPEPAWLHLQLGPPESSVPPPGPKEPLFKPRWVRGLLTAMLASAAEGVDFDIDAMAEHAAQAKPIPLIYQRVATLRLGVQVLLDLGAGMTPFVDDYRQLIAALEKLFPGDLLDVQVFSDDPMSGQRANSLNCWPPLRRPVLAVTDLGYGSLSIGNPTREQRWVSFARRLAERRSALCVLTPHPRERWPAKLGKIVAFIYWDRATTASMVSGQVRSRRFRRSMQ